MQEVEDGEEKGQIEASRSEKGADEEEEKVLDGTKPEAEVQQHQQPSLVNVANWQILPA